MYKKGGIYRKMFQKGGARAGCAPPPLNPPLLVHIIESIVGIVGSSALSSLSS